jgi:hypothetical protein
MPQPPSKKLHATGSFNSNGNNTLIAAPPVGSEIVISHFMLQNTTATPTTAKLLAGSFPFFQRLFQTQGDSYSIAYDDGREERLGSANALTLNLSGANAFNVVIGYWVDAKQ